MRNILKVLDNDNTVFDTSSYCATVVSQCSSGLMAGSVDQDKYLPEFIQKMYDAGGKKIMKENKSRSMNRKQKK